MGKLLMTMCHVQLYRFRLDMEIIPLGQGTVSEVRVATADALQPDEAVPLDKLFFFLKMTCCLILCGTI